MLNDSAIDEVEMPTNMQRSNSMPHGPAPPTGGSMGFGFLQRKASMGQGLGAAPMGMTGIAAVDVNKGEKRHFDPSKEPRLLGLL